LISSRVLPNHIKQRKRRRKDVENGLEQEDGSGRGDEVLTGLGRMKGTRLTKKVKEVVLGIEGFSVSVGAWFQICCRPASLDNLGR
jgi:hypothetical protein